VKNKLAPPFKQVEFDIMYGEGVSKMGEILDLGVKAGIVEKSGAWFSYDSQRLGQGRENSKAFLKANPDITAKIETAIRQNSGLIAEQILRDLELSDPSWRIATLRYFNPVGAHESGLIGEDPGGVPNNLMPYVAQVAVGKLERLRVFGGDYDTPDGTGVRDYIHVVDLARGHIAALDALVTRDASFVVNLGTGQGYSVLDVVKAFEKASGKAVPYEIVARRPGDVAQCFANPAKALDVIGWEAQYGIERMCTDHWRWQAQNPRGFE